MSIERHLGRPAVVALAAVLGVGLALAIVDPFVPFLYLSFAATGAFIVVRRPRHGIGWLLIVIAFGFIGTTSSDLDLTSLRAGTAGLGDTVRAWLAGWSVDAMFMALFALTVVFPSGRLPRGRWGLAAGIVLAAGVVLAVLTAFAPTLHLNPQGGAVAISLANPFALAPDLPTWSLLPSPDVFVLPIVLLLVAGVVSIIVRYRRSSGVLRLQLRWLVAAVSFMVVSVLTALVLLQVFGDRIGGAAWVPAVVAYPMIPLAIAIAVLRYRLFEIDRLISRTIAYAVVIGLLGALFVVLILGLQALLQPFTQGQTVAVAASTLTVAAVFQPVLRRVRRTVDHRFDRARYDGDRTATAFSQRLRDETDLAAVTSDLTGTARAALSPTTLGVWIRRNETDSPRASVTISGRPPTTVTPT